MILQTLQHVYKSFVVAIHTFCLPEATAGSGARWAAAQPLCEQSYFPLAEAEKIRTERSSFSWECPVVGDRRLLEQHLYSTWDKG